jgi:hypothetical protein
MYKKMTKKLKNIFDNKAVLKIFKLLDDYGPIKFLELLINKIEEQAPTLKSSKDCEPNNDALEIVQKVQSLFDADISKRSTNIYRTYLNDIEIITADQLIRSVEDSSNLPAGTEKNIKNISDLQNQLKEFYSHRVVEWSNAKFNDIFQVETKDWLELQLQKFKELSHQGMGYVIQIAARDTTRIFSEKEQCYINEAHIWEHKLVRGAKKVTKLLELYKESGHPLSAEYLAQKSLIIDSIDIKANFCQCLEDFPPIGMVNLTPDEL